MSFENRDNLSESKNNPTPDALFPTKWRRSLPVLWGVPETGLPGKTKKRGISEANSRIIRMLGTATEDFRASREAAAVFFGNGKKLLRAVLQALNVHENQNGAFLLLAVARALPALKRLEGLKQNVLDEIFQTLCQAAEEVRALSVEDFPVPYLLLAGELPLTLAFSFPQAEKTEAFLRQSRQTLDITLDVLLDGAGMVKAKNIPVSRVLLASWTRMKWLDRDLCARQETLNASPVFSEFARHQYEWNVRCAIHLTRPDGTLMFSPGSAKHGTWTPELFAAAVSVDEDADDKNLAVLALPGSTKEAVAAAEQEPQPEETNISDWSAVAVLRGAWDREEAHCSLTWDGPVPELEITNLGMTLISGPWACDIRWDGKPLVPEDTWDVVCKETGDEVDYVELEMLLSDAFRLQRSITLAKREGFVMLADAILPPTQVMESSLKFQFPYPEPVANKKPSATRGLQYTARIPLFSGIKAGVNRDSFELSLYTPREIKALALPLALPEWRTQAASVEGFTCRGNVLEYRCHSPQETLFAPLFFDLYDERLHSSLTWRRLTVAQKLQKIPACIASGTRVMVADSQWLIYRSLTPAVNRTLLGHNLTSETFIGTFDAEGQVDAILEIR